MSTNHDGEELLEYLGKPYGGLIEDSPTHNQAALADEAEMLALPASATCDPSLGIDACKWLDDYIAFSKKWSPCSFEGFHEACGLWLLSTVAARRVLVHLGYPRYTNLYFAMTARSTLHAKTSAARIAIQILQRAGLDYLLCPDHATPEKFISNLTQKVPSNYDELDDERQIFYRLRAGMAGQRGWYYDEFHRHIAAMLREGGYMAEFLGILLSFDDTKERDENGTIGRGDEVIERPYLALLGNMTPDEFHPFAKKGAGSLWGDGFLARFATVTAPEDNHLRGFYPKGECIIPGELLTPLVNWHLSLGQPDVQVKDVMNEKDKPTGVKHVEVIPSPGQTLDLSDAVYDAYYNYHHGMLDLLEQTQNHDLDANYGRFAEKGIRVAELFASFSGNSTIEIKHWARAQQITERWRAGLHELYRQVNEQPLSEAKEKEERVLSIVQKLGGATPNDVVRRVRNMGRAEAAYILDGLVHVGELEADSIRGGSKRYVFSTQ